MSLVDPVKLGDHIKLSDVTKVSASGIVDNGRVREIVLMRSLNFMRSTAVLLNWRPDQYLRTLDDNAFLT